MLLDRGANINVKDKKNFTPLLLAATHFHVNIMKILLENGANASLATKDKETPLHLYTEAIINQRDYRIVNDVHILEKLMPQNVNQINGAGFTALSIAVLGISHQPNCLPNCLHLYIFIKMLIKYGADINCPYENGRSPISMAQQAGDQYLIKLLSPSEKNPSHTPKVK